MLKIDQDKIVILDFGSQYTQLIARRIREIGVLSEIVSCEISPKELLKLKFRLCATRGTADYIQKHGMSCKIINKVSSGSPHIVDVLDSKKIALVINTGGGKQNTD